MISDFLSQQGDDEYGGYGRYGNTFDKDIDDLFERS